MKSFLQTLYLSSLLVLIQPRPFLVRLVGRQALSPHSRLQATSKHGFCFCSPEPFLTKVTTDSHIQQASSNQTPAFLVEMWLQLLLRCCLCEIFLLWLLDFPKILNMMHFLPQLLSIPSALPWARSWGSTVSPCRVMGPGFKVCQSPTSAHDLTHQGRYQCALLGR